MRTGQDKLRDELVAVLGAGRELPAETDDQLAEAFLRFMEVQREGGITSVDPVDSPHQPHYSLMIAGGVWGAALMFLFLLLLLSNLYPLVYLLTVIAVLTVVAAGTKTFLYLARHGWQLPHVHVEVAPPTPRSQDRG